ncbi:hypothetical protein [Maridesulfovibrio zosterae]|uniref:hypothetical protein n=1 Tax=Maridesulfovibrio zosterae TaxID=82171 RepID=UPI0003FB616B|nr:hypothetical protein [Maridesulfovibrio zosterae]
MISRFALMIVVAFMLAVSGCATHTVKLNKPESQYAQFKKTYSSCNSTGIKATASLYYSSEGKGHRTTITLWGDYELPLRLDVRAGIGAYVAHIREENAGLTAFYPDERTSYSHSSPLRAVQLLGLPFPFSLKDLAGLVSGCYQSLIPNVYNTVTPVAETKFRYSFDNSQISSIILNEQGVATEITGPNENPWKMELSAYELNDSGKMLPDKIIVYTGTGEKAVLRIKSRTFFAEKWPDEALKMELPDGTEKIKLDKNNYSKINLK